MYARGHESVLHDFGEGLEDGVVVDAREIERQGEVRQAGVMQLVGHPALDLVLAVDLLLVREEEVPVDLVDEHLEAHRRVHRVRQRYGPHEPAERVRVGLVAYAATRGGGFKPKSCKFRAFVRMQGGK